MLAAKSQVEVLRTVDAAATAGIDLTGNEFGNTLVGNRGAIILTGGGGMDRLTGDVGKDTLSGGSEGDTFVFFSYLDIVVV